MCIQDTPGNTHTLDQLVIFGKPRKKYGCFLCCGLQEISGIHGGMRDIKEYVGNQGICGMSKDITEFEGY